MKKKLISVSAVVLVLALLLTLAPSCGKEKGEVKTIKFGFAHPLSGFGGVWGHEFELGAEWAIDKVNAAGGIKVGADRYMIELVKCDTKLTGSVAAECATRFVDEGIHYALGEIIMNPAMNPITTPAKVWCAGGGNSTANVLGPEWPYTFTAAAPPIQWVGTFWDQAYQFHPEIQTVAIVNQDGQDEYLEGSRAAHAKHGREVVADVTYTMGTTDYYPILTPVVAKNPDAIDFSGGMKGDIDLMVKQARELGYTGILAGPAHGDPQSTIDIAGAEYAEGFICNDPDYSSDLYPKEVNELYAEFQQRHPGEPLALTTYLAFGEVMLYVQAIEEVESIDPDAVKTLFDDPDWEFEWFGMPGKSFGGLETVGIRRVVQDEVAYSEVINGEKVMKSRQPVVIP